MAVEIQPFNLAGILSNAETIRGQRAQNRLLALTEPYRVLELQRGEQDAVSAQREAELKRTGAAAKLALGVIGDVSSLTPEERQTRYASARQMVADLGVDVAKIPPTYSDDVYRGIQAIADQYGGAQEAKYGLNLIQAKDANGNDVLIQPMAGGPGYRVIEGVTPADKPVVDLETGSLIYPGANRVVPFGAGAQPEPQQRPAAGQPGGVQQPTTATGQPGAVVQPAPATGPSYEDLQRAKAQREAQAAAQKEAAVVSAREAAQTRTDRALSAPQARAALDSTQRRMSDTIADIDAAIAAIDATPGMTGLIGSAAALIPGTPQYNLSQKLGTIRSNQFLKEMKDLKAAGGSLGSATEREGEKLESATGSLSQGQSDTQLKQNLIRLRANYIESQRALESAFSDTYGVGSTNKQTATLPQSAASKLREGVSTTFGNGQVWTLRNGSPVRVR